MLALLATTKRLASVLCLLLLALGCASTRPEQVNGMDLNQQLNAYIDEYYDQVVDMCVDLQGKANSRQSLVGCAIRDNTMHVSFPTRAFHQQHVEEVARMYNHWCAAYGSKTGKTGAWVRHFRQEKQVESRFCTRRKPS